ncbi:MAG TPA: 3-oxoacyl-[acyl-carrier-protein] synthase III C-terminal domain-containing protein [Candidatus Thermoplasmatota archaeon]|nr:3-oxoacyl-[acyl-carrier-protein] synthase III C-terminal domain-containing protein [Candidatus Thermoplasmatota archaeon]
MPVVEAVAHAVPPTRLSQRRAKAVAESLFAERGAGDRLLDVFDNGRIRERALAMPLEWYFEDHGHADRAKAYADVGLALAAEATARALGRARLSPEDLGGILFVSTTGFATPSLDARLAERLGFRRDAVRLPVWGLGCAGGVAGLNRAADLARARPDERFLLVALELCSLAFDLPSLFSAAGNEGRADVDRKHLVAASLFADGCAAVVVAGDASGARGPRHAGGASHLFPATERVMGWDVTDRTLDVVISPEIPAIVQREMAALVEGLARGRTIHHWLLHPGGAKVLDAYATSLGLDDKALRHASDVLAAHGNMSSPTVLFALERALAEGSPAPGERALLAALGPGFASELALLEG